MLVIQEPGGRGRRTTARSVRAKEEVPRPGRALETALFSLFMGTVTKSPLNLSSQHLN